MPNFNTGHLWVLIIPCSNLFAFYLSAFTKVFTINIVTPITVAGRVLFKRETEPNEREKRWKKRT